MTVERTRQIFGQKMANLSDVEILDFIKNMSIIGDALIESAKRELTNKNTSSNITKYYARE